MDIHYTEESVEAVADELLKSLTLHEGGATVVGLSGDLGAGKTTLVKAIATKLSISETVTSPTFVIAKYYDTQDENFQKLIHIDAYRIEDITELDPLGWETMIGSPKTLIVLEWPEKIEGALPLSTTRFSINHTTEGRHISQI